MAENFDKLPALELRDGSRLLNTNLVADSGLTSFVVSIKLLGLLDDLFELRVRNTVSILDNNCLFHTRRLHDSNTCFLVRGRSLGWDEVFFSWDFLGLLIFGHLF